MQELPTRITLASAEQATEDSHPGKSEGTRILPQVLPEFVETCSGSAGKLTLAANNVVPSAEQAIEDQFVSGELVAAQVNPEFVDTYINPDGGLPYWPDTPAASFVPSADDAMQLQFVTGALVIFQLCACAEAAKTKLRMTFQNDARIA
jgi:hypothetical protein